MISLVIVHTLLYFHPIWIFVVVLATINGLGFGMAQTSIGTMLLETSILRKAVMLSRLEVSFGVGALAMPIISSFLITHQHWSASFAVIVLLAMSLTITWSFTHIDHKSASIKTMKDEEKRTASIKQLNLPQLTIFLCFVFLYVGIETSIINFLPSILVRRDALSTSDATLSVTFFWIAMVVGRILSGVIAEKVGYHRFLHYSSLGGLMFLIAIAVIKGMVASFALVFMLGLFLSGVFAIVIVFANQALNGSTKQTTSMLIAAGGIGGSILPLFIGWTMDQFQTSVTVWLLVICNALMCLLLLNVRRSVANYKKARKQTTEV
jgi:FHS family glucose/mannose:H+ symporter-like MFS transporter